MIISLNTANRHRPTATAGSASRSVAAATATRSQSTVGESDISLDHVSRACDMGHVSAGPDGRQPRGATWRIRRDRRAVRLGQDDDDEHPGLSRSTHRRTLSAGRHGGGRDGRRQARPGPQPHRSGSSSSRFNLLPRTIRARRWLRDAAPVPGRIAAPTRRAGEARARAARLGGRLDQRPRSCRARRRSAVAVARALVAGACAHPRPMSRPATSTATPARTSIALLSTAHAAGPARSFSSPTTRISPHRDPPDPPAQQAGRRNRPACTSSSVWPLSRLRTSRLRAALTMLGVIFGVVSVVALVVVGRDHVEHHHRLAGLGAPTS